MEDRVKRIKVLLVVLRKDNTKYPNHTINNTEIRRSFSESKGCELQKVPVIMAGLVGRGGEGIIG